MLKQLRAARRNDSGFTLTELLITIVILGVLAGIVVFAVSAFTDDGVVVACQTDRKSVEIAVEAYLAKEGEVPDETTNDLRIDQLVDGGYLKSAPATDKGYTITLSATGVVSSTGVAGCNP